MVTIYAIYCFSTRKYYIGCTKAKPSKRLREHRCLLRVGRHPCRPLQEDWNILGETNVHGETNWGLLQLQQLPADVPLQEKREAELKWMRYYEKGKGLYNEHIISFSPTPDAVRKGIEASRHVEGNKRSPEANLKRSLAQKGIPKGHGAKISATKRAKREQVMR